MESPFNFVSALLSHLFGTRFFQNKIPPVSAPYQQNNSMQSSIKKSNSQPIPYQNRQNAQIHSKNNSQNNPLHHPQHHPQNHQTFQSQLQNSNHTSINVPNPLKSPLVGKRWSSSSENNYLRPQQQLLSSQISVPVQLAPSVASCGTLQIRRNIHNSVGLQSSSNSSVVSSNPEVVFRAPNTILRSNSNSRFKFASIKELPAPEQFCREPQTKLSMLYS